MSGRRSEQWENRAICRTAEPRPNPRLFFPDGAVGQAAAASYRVAKEWCEICPVRAACLAAAMTREGSATAKERWGVWGGLDPSERFALYKRQAAECAA
jgi:WhiB family redox-sensing transcriptional regulator